MEAHPMLRILKYIICFVVLAGIGTVLGCYIHASRVNQTTLMSGVALVREFPYGEQTVGMIETMVFSWQERQSLKEYRDKYKGKIKIDPEVLKKHKELYREGERGR
jgi:hypothetical protein